MSLMRVLLIAAVVALGARPASADTLGVLKDNTLTLTDAKGGVRTMLISADHTLMQGLPDGRVGSGAWQVGADGRFCFTPKGEATYCIPMPTDKDVGETWEIRGPTGVLSLTARIVEGRAGLGDQ